MDKDTPSLVYTYEYIMSQIIMSVYLEISSFAQVAFIVVVTLASIRAYEAVATLFARARARRRDVESPSSPVVRASLKEKDVASQAVPELEYDHAQLEEIRIHKDLYFKLQNLEQYPEILAQSRDLLISLFSETLADARKDPGSGILSVDSYTRENLGNFLKTENDKTTEQWEHYVARRKDRSPREMFADREEAIWWLKQAAPVKYVDGSWLGHINKITTPFALRRATKDAWQVMSEELGDGDLEKNHVEVYRNLMKEIGSGLPEGDTAEFIHPRHDLNERRVWKAAIAQLLISLFPHEFLPEILGFNMAYEGLPLHLMKTVKELEELKLNAYYFVLHISIDNAESGHAAMAMEAVIEYIEHMRTLHGDLAAEQAWRRVQTGFVLAEGLPTTPECPSSKKPPVDYFPRNNREAEVIKIFKAKAPVAHKIHCSSKLKIGRRTLVDWLEPNAFASKQWQMDFLHDLGNMKPWVCKGNSSKSKLIEELSWEGKMFGSFTQTEVEVVKRWIDSLGDFDRRLYWSFIGQDEITSNEICQKQDIRCDYPVLKQIRPEGLSPQAVASSTLNNTNIYGGSPGMDKFVPMWFAHPCLLENFVSIPAKVANKTGSAIVRLLRAQSGFGIEGPGVAGMDEVRRTDAVGLVEIGLEMMKTSGLPTPSHLKEALENRDEDFATTMMHFSMKPMQNGSLLLGLTWAFMQLHEAMASSSLLSSIGQKRLREIARRERESLDLCLEDLKTDDVRYADFCRGYNLGRAEIDSCFW